MLVIFGYFVIIFITLGFNIACYIREKLVTMDLMELLVMMEEMVMME